MKQLELLIERVILASRWLLVVFYVGLAAALAVYAVSFALKFFKIAVAVVALSEEEMILAMLSLIAAALAASLIVMVMISSYENFVSRFEEHTQDLSWLGTTTARSCGLNLMHLAFMASAVFLGLLDRISAGPKKL